MSKFTTKSDLLVNLRAKSRDFLDQFTEIVLNDSLNKVKVNAEQSTDNVIRDLSSVPFAILKNAYILASNTDLEVQNDEDDEGTSFYDDNSDEDLDEDDSEDKNDDENEEEEEDEDDFY